MLWEVVAGFTLLILAKCDKWSCPVVVDTSCTCDLPRTLRCSGNQTILPRIEESLSKHSDPYYVSLLDCTLQDLEVIDGPILKGVSLNGLVISSGILKLVTPEAFVELKGPLQALGLPNNMLTSVPTVALKHLNALVRLDLSHNSLFQLTAYSFQGLYSLEILDLRENKLENIDSSTFMQLPRLKILRIQSNLLRADSISKLQGLFSLEQLDLSSNSISGSLNATTLPVLPRLIFLNLAHNQISSVKKGTLSGLDSLNILSLDYNMIDILEDNAFSELKNLISLDLAHNRIVTVSESSLAHLHKLEHLDVSHNFLRALTADLISPLINLRQLKLDDNDVSIIEKNVFKSTKHLELLTLSENPLNCDCNLVYFAAWLHNSTISLKNKNTAVCATPPSLENGLVGEILIDQMSCASEDNNFLLNKPEHLMPVSESQITLSAYNYDGTTTYLLWKIETTALYHCDSLFVYEELGSHEILLERNRLHCNSTDLADAHILPVSLGISLLQEGHRYRYCIVMVEKKESDSLILGCSEVLTLLKKISPQIISLKVNSTLNNELSIHAQIWPHNSPCFVTFYISVLSKKYKQKKHNCSSPKVSIKDLSMSSPLKICAVISDLTPYCIWTYPQSQRSLKEDNSFFSLTFLIVFIIFILLILIIYIWVKRLFKQPKIHEQCFLPASSDEQYSKYIKLQPITKF